MSIPKTAASLAAVLLTGYATGAVAQSRIPLSEWQATAGIDRMAWLRSKWSIATAGAVTNHQKAVAFNKWVQASFYHPPITVALPTYATGRMVEDPVILWKYRARAYCGQVARFIVDMVIANGWRGRLVQLQNHVAAEIFYDGKWHYLDGDALDGGTWVRAPDGTVASVAEILANPAIVDDIHVTNTAFLSYPWPPNKALTYYSVPYRDLFRRVRYPQSVSPYGHLKTATISQSENERYGWNYLKVVQPWP